MGAECQGLLQGGDLCPNLRFKRLRLTSGVDEVAVTAFLLSDLKAVHPFLPAGVDVRGCEEVEATRGSSFSKPTTAVLYYSGVGVA